ncbi:PQQ-dependent sugar dehydrogenase [Hyphococcus flavus]|uniref:PQQ-dependent sugar dehydrogenase n=1 Tax=Hyphococcus flavus TaxID=1866326 RepID=A0AAE9ZCW0_9PROT|nr:PQQ-dependent sugar dehydrogenase [Hyphococcus flavus]WDI31190.1 PQQ-dependent sugar dehydrogenase [Hyphococcus flavus]
MRILFGSAGASFLALALTACGGSSDGTPPPAPQNPPANNAPSFTSGGTASIQENTIGAFYTATANDADGDSLTFSISGGADAALFTLTGATLSFVSPPDFEAPQDGNTDNVYALTLRVSDGTATSTLNLNVTVTDQAENFAVRRVTASASAPLSLVGRAGGDVLVGERSGVIRILNPATGTFNATPFLDISATIGTAGEGGLLGFTLAPDYAASGTFYVHVTNTLGDTEVRSYQRSAGDPDVADAGSGDVILTAPQPDTNHNGGWIDFGSDGFLYLSIGDGGGAGDPFANGQDQDTLLGAILRIDPASDDFPGDTARDYAIPAGNPFAGGGGAPEIWAYGLRNPFRASFDRDTGDLYIGDVGQAVIEEIDLIAAGDGGRNFGWNVREGTQMFTGPDSGAFTSPIAEYGHGSGPRQGNSITGGFVYRGPVTSLQGQYIFADFISDNIWSFPIDATGQGSTLSSDSFILRNDAFTPDAGTLEGIVGFGDDASGNLYILTISGSIFVIEPTP